MKNMQPEKFGAYEYQLKNSPSWLIMIASGCDLDEAREVLLDKFGDRLVAVRYLTLRG